MSNMFDKDNAEKKMSFLSIWINGNFCMFSTSVNIKTDC